MKTIEEVWAQLNRDIRAWSDNYPDLADRDTYTMHAKLVTDIANRIVLAPQHRMFQIDENNKRVIRFLLLYFNRCAEAENVFPDRGYKLHKNLMLVGDVGAGKTLLMQIFAEYLKRIGNPMAFHNISVTQMVNYHSIHNNIDRFTYNEAGCKGFEGKPYHLCLNDIGVDNRKFYGVDTLTLINDFLHARNEIWSNRDIDKRFAHLTTNLTVEQLVSIFNDKDAYGRVVDRFKTYNVIPLPGKSRR